MERTMLVRDESESLLNIPDTNSSIHEVIKVEISDFWIV